MEKHKKVWGEELWIANNELYCGKILYLNENYRCSIHHHKIKDETFYILDGIVLMEIEGKFRIMRQGDSIRLKPNTKHRFTGITDSQILEISTQHFEEDSYRETESGRVWDL